jgi:signal transduction histidine kinase
MAPEPLASDLDEQLAAHRATGALPAHERAWLAAHGIRERHALGDVITRKGEQATRLFVLFRGHLVIRVDRGAGMHKVFEWQAGEIGGTMPYSRGATPPNDVVVESEADMLTIDRTLFPTLTRECPELTAFCVHTMVDRARHFTQADLRDDKLISLGKLAAGLAHELNNPASAVVRGAKLLGESIAVSEEAARKLGAAGLSPAQLARIDAIRALCLRAAPTMMRSALGRSDREDELADWLADHDADERCAGPLSETAVTIEALDALAAVAPGEVLNVVLKWMAAGCNVRMLSSDIETAATRIHGLVGAVKGFTFMDHAPRPEPVDIRQGVYDTLVMLAAKTRARQAQVDIVMPDDLPRAHAVGAELNQVWMNLIDNALDAVPQGGRVTVSATGEPTALVVRVVDNGAGIPPEVQRRIFDPFFTTKGVGQGSGLGLDIVRRLIKQHDGEIAVTSEPGRTEFTVRLPLAR